CRIQLSSLSRSQFHLRSFHFSSSAPNGTRSVKPTRCGTSTSGGGSKFSWSSAPSDSIALLTSSSHVCQLTSIIVLILLAASSFKPLGYSSSQECGHVPKR